MGTSCDKNEHSLTMSGDTCKLIPGVLDKNNSQQSLRWQLISKFHQTCLSS